MAESSLVVIYVYGCSSCGKTGRQVKRIVSFARANNLDVEIKYTSHDKQNREEHMKHLIDAGISTVGYPPIVLLAGKTQKVLEWNL